MVTASGDISSSRSESHTCSLKRTSDQSYGSLVLIFITWFYTRTPAKPCTAACHSPTREAACSPWGLFCRPTRKTMRLAFWM